MRRGRGLWCVDGMAPSPPCDANRLLASIGLSIPLPQQAILMSDSTQSSWILLQGHCKLSLALL